MTKRLIVLTIALGAAAALLHGLLFAQSLTPPGNYISAVQRQRSSTRIRPVWASSRVNSPSLRTSWCVVDRLVQIMPAFTPLKVISRT